MSFKRLDSEDFTFDIDSVVAPVWSTNSSSLKLNFYSSSIQQSSIGSSYYTDVYSSDPNFDSNAQVQFSIAWADKDGSGSYWYSPITPGQSPSRTVYGQFINLLFGEDENPSFNFGGDNNEGKYFYAITINRSRYKQSIMPGSLQIKGLADNINIYITDNSRIANTVDYTNAGRRYTLGSGSFGDGVIPSNLITSNRGIYGYLYPDVGIIILNPLSFNPVLYNDPYLYVWKRSNNINDNNPDRLRQHLQYIGGFQPLPVFDLLGEETVSSNYIFCRAQNHEFNYSTNPSFKNSLYSSSLNEYMQTPSTYITTVGLYNDNNELLAVAKLSKPLKKDFITEALIRVKLDF